MLFDFSFLRPIRSAIHPASSREDSMLSAIHGYDVSDKVGLEFGPLFRPAVRRDMGRIYYLDHMSTEELRKKYVGDPAIDRDSIVDIDFVFDGRPLVEITEGVAPFDYMVAAHVIEHVPDLVGWLKSIEDALVPGGVLCLAIPDKRFTFDLYRPLSSIHEIAAAHAERRAKPGLRVIMDHYANVVNANKTTLWASYKHAASVPFMFGPEVLAVAQSHFLGNHYVDVHNWVFTPQHFFKLMGFMSDAYGLGFNLRWDETTQPDDLQFFVQLEKTEAGRSTTDWAAKARQAVDEAIWPHNGANIARELGIAT